LGLSKGNQSADKITDKRVEVSWCRSISFQGELQVGTISILGKGYVGVVVLGKIGRKKVAVKIRRSDSPRKNLKKEAELLKITNRSNVGPKLVGFSKNFLVMEYLDGKKIGDWIASLKKKGSSSQLKTVINKVLEDCYSLDRIGLDHGELSNITKHVIVGNKTTIIDFESSSTDRKVSNVTSATQALCIGSRISKMVGGMYKIPKKEKMISVLREYKQKQTRDSFEKLLDVLKL